MRHWKKHRPAFFQAIEVLGSIAYNKKNCGSCFAAEQFVDIELGAKELLPLTSLKEF